MKLAARAPAAGYPNSEAGEIRAASAAPQTQDGCVEAIGNELRMAARQPGRWPGLGEG